MKYVINHDYRHLPQRSLVDNPTQTLFRLRYSIESPPDFLYVLLTVLELIINTTHDSKKSMNSMDIKTYSTDAPQC